MATVVPIVDAADPRLDDYLRLTDAELRRRGEVFLAEGVLVIQRAIAAGMTFRSLLLTAERLAALEADITALDAPAYVVAQDVMNAVTGFNLHRGAIAAVARPPERDAKELLSGRTIAVLEGINDFENLGALFRNAAALGVDAVLLDATTGDPLYRRSVRVSLGHVLAVPFARYDDLATIEDAGYELVALTPDGSAELVDVLDDLDQVALLLGAEGPGLRAETLARAHRRVRIPMVPGIDSLNVATAAAVAFHRRFRGG